MAILNPILDKFIKHLSDMGLIHHHFPSGHANRYGSAISVIVLTCLFAGMLHAAALVLVYDVRPSRLFQFIASGLFGKEALMGGLFMALSGLMLHFIISFAWTAFYFIAYPTFKMFAGHKIFAGSIYGVIVWTIMNTVVIPFSSIAEGPLTITQDVIGILITIVSIGLPVATLARRYYTAES